MTVTTGRPRGAAGTAAPPTPVPDAVFGTEEYEIDPRLHTGSDDQDDAPDIKVWENSFHTEWALRRVNDGRWAARRKARDLLVEQMERQVPYLTLFQKLPEDPKETAGKDDGQGAAGEDGKSFDQLFVLVFPGNTDDCTGTKDLNDKIIGYTLNARYIEERNGRIRDLFESSGQSRDSSPWRGIFTVISQSYKSTVFGARSSDVEARATVDTRNAFDEAMEEMDRRFSETLLDYVEQALKEDRAEDPEAAKDLRKKLKGGHTFEMFYGQASLPTADTRAEVIYRASSDCTKAAGIARADYKRNGNESGNYDPRGHPFAFPDYKDFARRSRELRERIRSNNGGKIKVDGVPAIVFDDDGEPNRHVLRDARKNKLDPDNEAEELQKEWIDQYILVLNTMDFLKDFHHRAEFPGTVQEHLSAGDAHQQELRGDEDVDRKEITDFMREDLRGEVTPALGRASEYLFYATTAEFADRLILILDVRDLGVDVLVQYHHAVERVIDTSEDQLLPITLSSTDPIVEHKRYTFELVKEHFREKYPKVMKKVREGDIPYKRLSEMWGRPEWYFRRLFHPPERTGLDRSTRGLAFLLGGDEVFVSAHPAYLTVVAEILAEICPPDQANVRAAVVASSAARKSGGQRRANAIAHDSAMEAADESMAALKSFERDEHRLRRRIERVEDPGERKAFTKCLDRLALLDLYRQVRQREVGPLIEIGRRNLSDWVAQNRPNEYPGQFRRLESGRTVDGVELKKKVDKLEEAIKDSTPPIRR